MKKILITLGVLTLFTLKSMAQDDRSKFKIGLKAGANISNIYDKTGEVFTADYKIGFTGGLFMGIPIGKFLGIQPEILFSQKGYNSSGTLGGITFSQTRTTDYIDIPLFISIKPSNFLTIKAGPQYSFLMKQKDVFKNSVFTSEQIQQFDNTNIRKNILGLVGGVDVNISKLIIGARVGMELQNNNGDGTSTNPRYKNAWGALTLGFNVI
ncbi:PorT family protein [Lacihabitans sp. LS3-19]|uniref:porin family protein n=1 Tax=Lacihabitans sp. LS3-19 TaxID=2487335 RepID=UPI0020CCA8B7|nr:porin family protein [Lacihabitans sp. LS3-19]MCP9768671.1 PorT family protein [Lacihabitans sp. LS3-19]